LSDTTTQDVTAVASWMCSDPSKAAYTTVLGAFKPIAAGTVQITATYLALCSAPAVLVILPDNPVVSIEVTPSNAT